MSTKLYRVFVDNVRARMDALGMSQRDLALRLDVTQAYVSQIMSGTSRPGLESLDRFAQVLQVEAYELIREPGEKSVASA